MGKPKRMRFTIKKKVKFGNSAAKDKEFLEQGKKLLTDNDRYRRASEITEKMKEAGINEKNVYQYFDLATADRLNYEAGIAHIFGSPEFQITSAKWIAECKQKKAEKEKKK